MVASTPGEALAAAGAAPDREAKFAVLSALIRAPCSAEEAEALLTELESMKISPESIEVQIRVADRFPDVGERFMERLLSSTSRRAQFKSSQWMRKHRSPTELMKYVQASELPRWVRSRLAASAGGTKAMLTATDIDNIKVSAGPVRAARVLHAADPSTVAQQLPVLFKACESCGSKPLLSVVTRQPDVVLEFFRKRIRQVVQPSRRRGEESYIFVHLAKVRPWAIASLIEDECASENVFLFHRAVLQAAILAPSRVLPVLATVTKVHSGSDGILGDYLSEWMSLAKVAVWALPCERAQNPDALGPEAAGELLQTVFQELLSCEMSSNRRFGSTVMTAAADLHVNWKGLAGAQALRKSLQKNPEHRVVPVLDERVVVLSLTKRDPDEWRCLIQRMLNLGLDEPLFTRCFLEIADKIAFAATRPRSYVSTFDHLSRFFKALPTALVNGMRARCFEFLPTAAALDEWRDYFVAENDLKARCKSSLPNERHAGYRRLLHCVKNSANPACATSALTYVAYMLKNEEDTERTSVLEILTEWSDWAWTEEQAVPMEELAVQFVQARTRDRETSDAWTDLLHRWLSLPLCGGPAPLAAFAKGILPRLIDAGVLLASETLKSSESFRRRSAKVSFWSGLLDILADEEELDTLNIWETSRSLAVLPCEGLLDEMLGGWAEELGADSSGVASKLEHVVSVLCTVCKVELGDLRKDTGDSDGTDDSDEDTSNGSYCGKGKGKGRGRGRRRGRGKPVRGVQSETTLSRFRKGGSCANGVEALKRHLKTVVDALVSASPEEQLRARHGNLLCHLSGKLMGDEFVAVFAPLHQRLAECGAAIVASGTVDPCSWACCAHRLSVMHPSCDWAVQLSQSVLDAADTQTLHSLASCLEMEEAMCSSLFMDRLAALVALSVPPAMGIENDWEIVAPTFDEVNTPVPKAQSTAALGFGRAMSYFFADPSSREQKLMAWWQAPGRSDSEKALLLTACEPAARLAHYRRQDLISDSASAMTTIWPEFLAYHNFWVRPEHRLRKTIEGSTSGLSNTLCHSRGHAMWPSKVREQFVQAMLEPMLRISEKVSWPVQPEGCNRSRRLPMAEPQPGRLPVLSSLCASRLGSTSRAVVAIEECVRAITELPGSTLAASAAQVIRGFLAAVTNEDNSHVALAIVRKLVVNEDRTVSKLAADRLGQTLVRLPGAEAMEVIKELFGKIKHRIAARVKLCRVVGEIRPKGFVRFLLDHCWLGATTGDTASADVAKAVLAVICNGQILLDPDEGEAAWQIIENVVQMSNRTVEGDAKKEMPTTVIGLLNYLMPPRAQEAPFDYALSLLRSRAGCPRETLLAMPRLRALLLHRASVVAMDDDTDVTSALLIVFKHVILSAPPAFPQDIARQLADAVSAVGIRVAPCQGGDAVVKVALQALVEMSSAQPETCKTLLFKWIRTVAGAAATEAASSPSWVRGSADRPCLRRFLEVLPPSRRTEAVDAELAREVADAIAGDDDEFLAKLPRFLLQKLRLRWLFSAVNWRDPRQAATQIKFAETYILGRDPSLDTVFVDLVKADSIRHCSETLCQALMEGNLACQLLVVESVITFGAQKAWASGWWTSFVQGLRNSPQPRVQLRASEIFFDDVKGGSDSDDY